jgi:hypothetical protein
MRGKSRRLFRQCVACGCRIELIEKVGQTAIE